MADDVAGDRSTHTAYAATTNFGALQERVYALDRTMSAFRSDMFNTNAELFKRLENLATKQDAISKPDLKLWVSLFGLIILCGGLLWGLAITPIRGDLDRVVTAVDKLKESVVPRTETVERNAYTDRSILKLDDEIRALEGRVVTHSDVDGLKIELNARILEMNRRLGKGG